MDYIVAVFAFVIGVGALWTARHVRTRVRTERGWPTVPGTILERGIGSMSAGDTSSSVPEVKYSYAVGGTNYVNDQVYLVGRIGGSEDQIQRLLDDLPDPVPVHYNPQDPEKSYLLLTPGSGAWLLLAAGVFAILFALVFLLSALG